MEKIKDWFATYEAQVAAILETIYNFVLAIFNKEVAGEFEDLLK